MSDEFNISNLVFTKPFERNLIHKISVDRFGGKETPYDQKVRTLKQLKLVCFSCSMCPLGLRDATVNGISRDPHVFSNLHPSKYLVLADRPTYNDTKECCPRSIADRFAKYANIHQFYFTYSTKCLNTRGDDVDSSVCFKLFELEFAIVRPKLILAEPESYKKLGSSDVYEGIPVIEIETDEQIQEFCLAAGLK